MGPNQPGLDLILLIGRIPPSPSPISVEPQAPMSPQWEFLVAVAVALFVGFAITGFRLMVHEFLANQRVRCICGHKVKSHEGPGPTPCKECKCRDFIQEWRQ